MREIKFRAWDKKHSRMTPIIALGLLSKEAVGDSCTLKFNKDCELLQYTGLKDKDGKEIYDGDIVTH